MKAQDYILGSGGRVAFVVVITVSRRNKGNTDGDGRDQIRPGQHLDSTSDLENNETNGAMSEGGAGPVAKSMQQELTVGDQRRISSSPISTLTDPPSDLSLWNVFTERNPEAQQASQRRGSESIRLPPLLYSALDSGDTLNVGDTVHASVFKSVFIPSPTPEDPLRKARTLQCLIEDAEMYPRATSASFPMAWTDIAKTAPANAGPLLHVDLGPLARLALRLSSDDLEERPDDGFSPLSKMNVDQEILFTSSSADIDHERSGGTVPSEVEHRRDPEYAPAECRINTSAR